LIDGQIEWLVNIKTRCKTLITVTRHYVHNNGLLFKDKFRDVSQNRHGIEIWEWHSQVFNNISASVTKYAHMAQKEQRIETYIIARTSSNYIIDHY